MVGVDFESVTVRQTLELEIFSRTMWSVRVPHVVCACVTRGFLPSPPPQLSLSFPSQIVGSDSQLGFG
jgi:hypothetical protein